MSFYVYQNWTHDRVRVHRGDCGHCKDGKGSQPNATGSNGRWYGPYESQESALRIAKSLDQRDTRPCGHCAV